MCAILNRNICFHFLYQLVVPCFNDTDAQTKHEDTDEVYLFEESDSKSVVAESFDVVKERFRKIYVCEPTVVVRQRAVTR